MGGQVSQFPDPKMSGVQAEMDELIQSKAVLVISKSYCPYCKKAKQVPHKYTKNTQYIKPGACQVQDWSWEVWDHWDRQQKRHGRDPGLHEKSNNFWHFHVNKYLIFQLTGGSSVPRVFIGGRCIGGGDETAAAHKLDHHCHRLCLCLCHRFLCAALGKEALLVTIGSNSDILLQLLYCQHVFRNGKLEAMLKEAGALLE